MDFFHIETKLFSPSFRIGLSNPRLQDSFHSEFSKLCDGVRSRAMVSVLALNFYTQIVRICSEKSISNPQVRESSCCMWGIGQSGSAEDLHKVRDLTRAHLRQ